MSQRLDDLLFEDPSEPYDQRRALQVLSHRVRTQDLDAPTGGRSVSHDFIVLRPRNR